MGRHEEARDVHQARDRAEPDAAARAGEPRHRAPEAQRAAQPARAARAMRCADGSRAEGAARALQPRPRLPAEGLLRRGAARVPPGARARARTAASCSRRWPRCTCCAASSAGARAVRRRWSTRSPTRPSSGTSAASCCIRRGAGTRRSAPTGAPSQIDAGVRARLEQPRRRAGAPGRRRGRRRSVPRRARRGSRTFAAARLNLALLLFQQRHGSSSRSRRTAQVLSRRAGERRRRGTASASCSSSSSASRTRATRSGAPWRPIRGTPGRTTTSASRSPTSATSTARSARPSARSSSIRYYVPQKFALTIDLQYEDPDIAIVPQISADVTAEIARAEFSFDRRLLDQLFAGAGAAGRRRPSSAPRRATRWRWRATTSRKGLLDLAAAEAMRGLAARRRPHRGHHAPRRHLTPSAGCYGEALERYREARAPPPTTSRPRSARSRRCWRSGARPRRRPLAEELLAGARGRRAAGGRGAGARRRRATRPPRSPRSQEAQTLRPGPRRPASSSRATSLSSVGDRDGALAAYRAALRSRSGDSSRSWVRARRHARAARGMARGAARLRAGARRCCRPTPRPRSRWPTLLRRLGRLAAPPSPGWSICWSTTPTISRRSSRSGAPCWRTAAQRGARGVPARPAVRPGARGRAVLRGRGAGPAAALPRGGPRAGSG